MLCVLKQACPYVCLRLSLCLSIKVSNSASHRSHQYLSLIEVKWSLLLFE